MTKGSLDQPHCLHFFFCENQEYEKTEKTPRQRPNISNPDSFSNVYLKAECAKDNSGGFI